MNDLEILNENGQLVVSSRQISENFSRTHKDVVNSIEKLIEGIGKSSSTYFMESEYKNEQNKQMYKEYLLNRDGFSLLVMGFNGPSALNWKLKYIKAFNEMEQFLKNVQPKLSKELQAIIMIDQRTTETISRLDKLENTMPLFNTDCKDLQFLVRKTGIKVLGGYKTPAYNDNSLRTKVYKDIQGQLKREFGVNRYESIKRIQMDTAKEILLKYIVPTYLFDDITLSNNQLEIPFSDLNN